MGKVLQEGAIWNLICFEKCAMKWGINITLRHLNISGGRHKSWHKSRDPHFSLAYKWETLFNTFKTISYCSFASNLVI